LKQKLLNPRGYLSPTQIQLFCNSPKKYISRYFYGEEGFTTKEMEFGKVVACALEVEEKTGDLITDMVISNLPKCPFREYDLKATLKSEYGDIHLLGKLDRFDEDNLIIREVKTGKVKWTIDRCKNSIQLLHYTALVWLKYNKFPNEVWLDYAETEGKGNDIHFTGNVVNIRVEFTVKDIISYLTLVVKVAREIDQLYRRYLNGERI